MSKFIDIIELRYENSDENSFKFYRLEPDADGTTFTATWGRVDTAGQTKTYPMDQWVKTLKGKLSKGYKIV